MTDLVKRLRAWRHDERLGDGMLLREAADYIDKLEAQVKHWKDARQSAIEGGDILKAEVERLTRDKELLEVRLKNATLDHGTLKTCSECGGEMSTLTVMEVVEDERNKTRAAEASNLRMTEELNLWGPIAAAAVRFVRAKHEDQEDAEDELRLYIEARRKRIAKSVALAASPPKGDADV